MSRLVNFPISFFRIAVVLLLVSGGGCAMYSTLAESLFMMSPAQEKELGTQVAQQVAQQYKFVDDPAVNDYVRTVGNKIWSNSPTSEFTPRFHVIKDDSLNAFAIPGGDIYLNTGLIAAADDEAELSSVIAHESAHVIRRHGARQISHEKGVALVEQLAVGKDSQLVVQLATAIAKQGALTTYSRADENESDTIAVNTLHRAGYDPLAMKRFFNKLNTKQSGGASIVKYFSTHPPTSQRIANVTTIAQSLPPTRGQAPVDGLRSVQARLKQLGLAPK